MKSNVVPLKPSAVEIETHLNVIVSALALVRGLASDIGSRDISVTGDALWGMLTLIETAARSALAANQAR